MNAAPDDINKLSGAIRDCDSAAGDMSAVMQDNLQGDMTLLSSAADGMKIRLSRELNPAMRDITQYITRNMPKIEKELGKVFKTGVSAVEFLVKNAPKVIRFVDRLKPAIIGTISAVMAYKLKDKAVEFIKMLGGGLGGLASPGGAISLAAGAFMDHKGKVGGQKRIPRRPYQRRVQGSIRANQGNKRYHERYERQLQRTGRHC